MIPIAPFAAAIGALLLFLVSFPLRGAGIQGAAALRGGNGYCSNGTAASVSSRVGNSVDEIVCYGDTAGCAALRLSSDVAANPPGPYVVSPYARPVSAGDVAYEAWHDPNDAGPARIVLPERYIWHAGQHPLSAGRR